MLRFTRLGFTTIGLLALTGCASFLDNTFDSQRTAFNNPLAPVALDHPNGSLPAVYDRRLKKSERRGFRERREAVRSIIEAREALESGTPVDPPQSPPPKRDGPEPVEP
ncbi:MAG: hypothetical protein AAGK01_06320 [Pseudomonadota bacterium]